MSVTALILWLVVLGAVVYLLELVIAAIERAGRLHADRRLAAGRDPHLYPASVVELAVYGALYTETGMDKGARVRARVVIDELRQGLVYDGHRMRSLDELDLDPLALEPQAE